MDGQVTEIDIFRSLVQNSVYRHRYQQQGHDQRYGKCCHDRDSDVFPDQLDQIIVREKERQEHGNRGDRGRHDCFPHFGSSPHTGLVGGNSQPLQSIDVLHNDDGVVQQHTDGECDTREG